MSNDISYTDALNELNEISHDIDNESIPLDELAKKVKRASELIAICRTKLRSTEDEVKKIIGEMGESK
ncbi:MAG: exodeoxyribonuclease VII small subunit [Bacteroidia bacterium]